MDYANRIYAKSAHTSDNKIKDAINLLTENIKSYVQSFARKAAIDSSDLELDHPKFQLYMLLVVAKSKTKLYSLKAKFSKEITKEEENDLKKLYEKSNFVQCSAKILYAAELFDNDLPEYIKNALISSGCPLSESEDSYDKYILVFSGFVVLLCDILTTNKVMQSIDNQSTFKNNDVVKSDDLVESNMKKTKAQTIKNEKIIDEAVECIVDLVCTTKKHCIYCVTNAFKKYALKVLLSNNKTLKDLNNLDKEYEVTKKALHPAYRSSVTRTIYQSNQALLLHWAPGYPISCINEQLRFGTKEFLCLGREIVSALLSMHMKQIMNRNLACDHMIYDPQSKSIKIIGLGSCTSFNNKKGCISNEELCQRDLRCISPEETGRLNQETDYRSDFYSIGVIFYKILTGKYPFEAENPLDLIHLHILQVPESMLDINPDIPLIISQFVSKLMKKHAQDRYLSAKGIIHDLDLMLSEYDIDSGLNTINLGLHNLSEIFCIPQKLCGRTNEYNLLCSILNNVSPNSFELAFVSGTSGSGKSALVVELYGVVAKRSGYFICGKFDQYKRDPYAAIIQAIEHFCEDLLLKEVSAIETHKTNILSAVGEEGRVLTNFIKNLHLIIGEQPIISDAFGIDAKNRFHYVFINFLKAICSTEVPIVLVLEDLQWIDNESFNILSAILADKCIKNLMLIGVYRNNEVNDDHPVSNLLKYIKTENHKLTEIQVENLDHESVNDIISDTLCLCNLETYVSNI